MHLHWHEGLFLQPHHLQNMQHQLQMDIRAARALFVPYCYGVLESRLSHDDLADGRIRFERLRAIMPSGQEIVFPEEANLPALDIKAELARGAGAMEVVLAAAALDKEPGQRFRPGRSGRPPDQAALYPGGRPGNGGRKHRRKCADYPRPQGQRPSRVCKGEDLSDMEHLPILRIICARRAWRPASRSKIRNLCRRRCC